VKPIHEVTACVSDYGTFQDLAKCLSGKCSKLYIYTPYEDEYRDVKRCCLGDGMPNVERCNDFMEPEIFDAIDLFCFPDIWSGGIQRYLRRAGKAVWGSMGAHDLELYRTRFLSTLEKQHLPVAPSVVIRGLDNLAAYLKEHKDQWVKVNRYRANMETWHHIDYEHSRPELARLAVEFGGLADFIVFVVQAPIPDAKEIGYDGIFVAGAGYPPQSFQGYEAKNELYLGSLLEASRLPDCVQEVNEAMAPVYEQLGYRNFIATEIRKTEDTFYFIDPTNRQAGQTMEHYYRNCANLPELIWAGANGELLQPEFESTHAAEATLHYTGAGGDGWRVLKVPEDARARIQLYHYCEPDEYCHFPPGLNDEVGVVVGLGDSVEECIEDLKANFALLEGEPVEIHCEGFAELIEQIEEAEAEGLDFTDGALPAPSIALKD
jgi:hypothetical protein